MTKPVLIFLSFFLVLGMSVGCSSDEPSPVDAGNRLEQDETESIKVDTLELSIAAPNFEKIKAVRTQALAARKLVTSGDDYVPATINFDGAGYGVKVRLKGDLPDHWKGDRWSFRVKCKGEQRLYGMRKFSLQDPETRNGVWEWIFHQALAEKGLMHLKYDFVHLSLNGDQKGTYALEEHMHNGLLERNNRDLGAILSFDESQYWKEHKNIPEDREEMYRIYRDNFDEAPVRFYNNSILKQHPELKNEHAMATALLMLFQMGDRTSKVFDVKKMAMFVALTDYVGAWHGLLWGNMRFYYNAETDKLEPIGFDMDAGYEEKTIAQENEKLLKLNGKFHEFLFSDATFVKEYHSALESLAEEDFWSEFMKKHSSEIEHYVSLIQRNDPSYQFDPSIIDKNFEMIQAVLARD